MWHGFPWMLERYGDVPSTLIVAGGTLVALGVRRRFALAARFAVYLAVAIAIGVTTKLAYYGWGFHFGVESFRAISGHAIRSCAVYPMFGFAVVAGSSVGRQRVGVVLGFAIALAIMMEGLVLRTHTPLEMIAGMLVGLSVFALIARDRRLESLSTSMQLCLAAGVLLASTSAAIPVRPVFDFEKAITRGGGELRHWTGAPPCETSQGLVTCDPSVASAKKEKQATTSE
jgi:hypothetical protein